MIELVLTKSNKVHLALLDAIKRANARACIVVLTTKPYDAFIHDVKGLDPSGMLFIDLAGGKDSDTVIAASPEDLTGFSIIISEALQSLPAEHRCVIFDSINPLLIHHPPKRLSEFFLFLTERVRNWKANACIIASTEAIDKELLSILEQAADETIGGGA